MGGDASPVANAAIKKIEGVLADKNLGTKVVGGDPSSSNLIGRFNKEYNQYKNHETLTDVLDAGEGKPSLSSSQIRARLSKLSDSEGFKYFSPEVQGAIKAAAKGKTSEKILSAVGSLKKLTGASLPYGSALPLIEAGSAIAAGNPAIAAVIGGVMGAGGAATQISKGSVSDILKAIQAGK